MAPTAQDRLKHAKEVAEWRINQGRRILDVQGRINDFEKQVQRSMQILSDTTYSQYKVGKNLLPEINSVCEDIEAIYSALENSRAELEAIKIEEAPSLEESSQVYSGLVCPECGKKLTGKFCPVHGNEGIKEAVTYTTSSAAESDLICPECSRPVMDKFCVNCGVEGVKKTSEVEFNSTKAAAKSKEPPAVKEEKSEEEVLICPDCGKELKDGMKFCNEHGKAGVPKSKMPAQKTATKKEEPPAKASSKHESVLVCPECGKELKEGIKFCNEHGKEGVPKVLPKAALEAENIEKPPTRKPAAKKTTTKKPSATSITTKKTTKAKEEG